MNVFKNLTIALCVFFPAINSQAQTTIAKWGYNFGLGCGVNFNCSDIVTDLNGNHIVAGTMYGNGVPGSGIAAPDLDPSTNGTFPNPSLVFTYDFYISSYDPAGNFISSFIIGGAGMDICNSISVDKGNNLIITGSFIGTVDFDPSAGASSVTANGGSDIFLAKYSNSGSLIWVKTFGGTLADVGKKVITDNQNNIFLTADFQSTLDIDPSSSSKILTSSGNVDVLISKFDLNGNHLASGSFGAAGIESSADIVLDKNKKLFMTGTYNSSVDFDPGVSTAVLTNTSSSPSTYISKFDSLLIFQWVKEIKSSKNHAPADINIDNNNNVLITGHYLSATIDLDPDAVTSVTFASSNGESGYLAKYDNNGVYLWAGTFGNSNLYYNRAQNIWSDNTGAVYSTGYVTGLIDFDLSAIGTFTINAGVAPSLYISKYSSSGVFISAKKLTGGYIYSNSSHADANGDILFAGNMNNGVNIDPTGNNPFVLSIPNQCGDYFDGFIAKYTECNIPSVTAVNATSTTVCPGTSITLTANGSLNAATSWLWSSNSCSSNTFATGSSVVVTPTASTSYHIKGIGGCAGTKLGCTTITVSVLPLANMTLGSSSPSICPGIPVKLSASGAPSHTWSVNNSSDPDILVKPTASATYSVSFTSTNGCVGTNTIDVTVFYVQPVTITFPFGGRTDTVCKGSDVYVSFAGGSQYTGSCKSCNAKFTTSGYDLYYNNIQSSESYTLFSKDANGCENGKVQNVEVIICTGLNELVDSESLVAVYPIPFSDQLLVHLRSDEVATIKIINNFGQEVYQTSALVLNGVTTINTINLKKGVFYLQVIKEGKISEVKKIIKQ